MTGTRHLLLCAVPVDDDEEDPRIASEYAASSAAMLDLFSNEVLAVKRWPNWGIPEAHFPAFSSFLAVYGVWREATLVDGAFDRGIKEIICACVSISSSCNFCANGHAVCARLGGIEGALTLLRDRNAGHIQDERVRTLATWALAVRDPDSESVRHPPPMSPRDAAELLGSVIHAIYKNVFASIFVGAGRLPDAFPKPMRSASKYPLAMAGMNRMMQLCLMPRSKRATPRRIREVWAQLPTPFDPSSVVLPPDLWWSMPNEAIADALRFMVVEQGRIETRWLPPPVATGVSQFINTEYRGLSLSHTDGATAAAVAAMPDVVSEDDVFLASFLLSAALDSSAVRGDMLDQFRHRYEHLDEAVELMMREVIS